MTFSKILRADGMEGHSTGAGEVLVREVNNGAPRDFRPVLHYDCKKGKAGKGGKR